jgi:DNA-binding YbaB/EbfC family protein
MFPGGQPDMAQLLQQAQQMQQQLVAAQEELARTEVTGSAGGGLVTATMTGGGDVTAVTIAPAAVDPDDLETLQDLVVAALHDAKRAVDELAARSQGVSAAAPAGVSASPASDRAERTSRNIPCTKVPSRT